MHRLSEDDIDGFRKLGIRVSGIVMSHWIAIILGTHFRENEWGKTRCGSVVVTSVNGITRYCVVDRFLKVGSRVFARVRWWFAVPSHPYAPNPLVVCACKAEQEEQQRLGCLLPVERIVPSQTYVEPYSDGIRYQLMRGSGY